MNLLSFAADDLDEHGLQLEKIVYQVLTIYFGEITKRLIIVYSSPKN